MRLAFGLPHEKPHATLYVGILLAAVGAGLVLFSKEYPEWEKAQAKQTQAAAEVTKAAAPPQSGYMWIVFVAMAGLAWGTYVPLIAQGGKELKNSYASFLCVGVAYFLIAVLIPVVIMSGRGNWPAWTTTEGGLNRGSIFATLSGVAGALGALCVIFATSEFKGPKIFVAPLIFAMAPIINTFFSLFWHPEVGAFALEMPTESPHWTFYLGLVAAGLGAGLVLYSKEKMEAEEAAAKAAREKALQEKAETSPVFGLPAN